MVTRGRDGVVGNKITYFKALSYSDVGVIGVESNSVSFRTFQTSRHFRLRFTLSSIIINWEGSYSSIKADWGDTSDFRAITNPVGYYRELYGRRDLSIGVLYYFRITPRTTTASWNRHDYSDVDVIYAYHNESCHQRIEHEFGFSYVGRFVFAR
jgi:hypothetical protein